MQGLRHPMKIRKAVFPVAGLGTRVLPATKAMPKEMLTIVDKPLIQYVVDEAKEAGIEHFIFVTGRNKGVIEDHFDRDVRTRRHARRARQEGRAGDSGARPARSRRHEFHPPAGAARPRPCGVVRARHRRRRAVRGGAAGRTGAEQAGLPDADDRGRGKTRRQSPICSRWKRCRTHLTHQYGICGVGKRTPATCSRSTAWWRSRRKARRRQIFPSPGAISCSRKSSRFWKPRSAARATRSSSPMR